MTPLGWVRTGYGVALIVLPGPSTRLLTGRSVDVSGRTIVRVLGVREATQSLVCAPRPTGAVLRVGVGVDVIHAATMLAVATRSSTWRRPALVSAAVATTFVVEALGVAQKLTRTTDSPSPSADAPEDPFDRLVGLRNRCALMILRAAPLIGTRIHRDGVQ